MAWHIRYNGFEEEEEFSTKKEAWDYINDVLLPDLSEGASYLSAIDPDRDEHDWTDPSEIEFDVYKD